MKFQNKLMLGAIALLTLSMVNSYGQSWLIGGNTVASGNTSNDIGSLNSKNLDLITNGNVRMRIQSNGDIGIGTTSPVALLHVAGNTQIDGKLFVGSGVENTFIGIAAGNSNSGSNNTAVGYQSLYSNTTGNGNTAMGDLSLYSNTIGEFNTVHGYQALHNNGTGDHNTAVGYRALYSSTFTNVNTAIGSEALYSNSSGGNNCAVGYQAGYSNTTGSQNLFFGKGAGHANTTGSSNSFFGSDVGSNNTTASHNSFFGNWSGLENTTGQFNSFFGSESGQRNTTGQENCFFGTNAGGFNSTGSDNSFFGRTAGFYNETGLENSFFGKDAGLNNVEGDWNSYFGQDAGLNCTGDHNTMAGEAAGEGSTSATGNTFIGAHAGDANTTGDNLSCIGYGTDVNVGTYSNSTCLGYSAAITASNQVRIGNASITSIGGYTSWSNISDGRFKRNVREDVKGLDFILKLRPVTYNLDVDGINHHVGMVNNYEGKVIQDDGEAVQEKQQLIYSGFIAQEVEAAAKELGYNFSGVDAPKNEKDLYGLRYAEFVVPLVKAVQELDENDDVQTTRLIAVEKENEKLKMENSDLKARLERIESQLGFTGENKQSLGIMDRATLEQNIPNPAKNTTTIGFYIPSEAGNAQLIITDASGKTIQQFSNLMIGQSQVEISISHLSAGAYQYSLYVDGKKVDTKQMIISN